ncbi:NAD(P)/FAD-dependent oxidoreductase [Pedobacter namyangjuensis]|uniref:NAD(P)/FAD-dependent oxidoreductase n=1 Tax=Pedobacter namyangjuensis TaxID=600626 RepID=UPI000DE1DD9D|nr:NAD(P)/FAD-dependent oxidoreductase [Pedobacter namyangjuensis]
MDTTNTFDVIIIGGSYAGLSAGMALGRSLRNVLIIDAGEPCNRQTPHSHNFLTQDGQTPAQISSIAKEQVLAYPTVSFLEDKVSDAKQTNAGFEVFTERGKRFGARKLIIATGIKDIFPEIKGFAECWGITVLHCPYCHGYEVKHENIGIIANGDVAFEFCRLIFNWTKNLTLFTNGTSTLSDEHKAKLASKKINIVEKEIAELVNENGQLQHILFKDETKHPLKAIFARGGLEQHATFASDLGCELNDFGFIKVNEFQETTVKGIFAAGDCTTMMRSVALSVSGGNMTGVIANKYLLEEDFG